MNRRIEKQISRSGRKIVYREQCHNKWFKVNDKYTKSSNYLVLAVKNNKYSVHEVPNSFVKTYKLRYKNYVKVFHKLETNGFCKEIGFGRNLKNLEHVSKQKERVQQFLKDYLKFMEEKNG